MASREWKVYYDVNYIIKRINRETQTSELRKRGARRERTSTSNNIIATKFVIRSGQKQKIERVWRASFAQRRKSSYQTTTHRKMAVSRVTVSTAIPRRIRFATKFRSGRRESHERLRFMMYSEFPVGIVLYRITSLHRFSYLCVSLI